MVSRRQVTTFLASSALLQGHDAPAWAESNGFYVGINLAGLEFDPGHYPGRLNINYRAPTRGDLQDYVQRGIKIFRLPILWERLQQQAFGALDGGYCSIIDGLVHAAHTLDALVILDLHNEAKYKGVNLGGLATPTRTLIDFWSKVSQRYAGRPGLLGYDLMNEPGPVTGNGGWPGLVQEIVFAVRRFDQKATIFVEGQAYSSAGLWTKFNNDLIITDPNKNLVYSAHVYLDRDNSGTHADWQQEAASGVTIKTGVERLTIFADWLKKNNLRGQIGEIGAGFNDQKWLDALSESLNFCKQRGVPVVYWAGGSAWGRTYPYYAGVRDGVSTPQLRVLEAFAKAT